MTEQEDYYVFAVVYSNYSPVEVASLWETDALAEKECHRLNDEDRDKGHPGIWEIRRMRVHTS